MVSETCECSAVLLRLELLCMGACLCVVDVQSVVGTCEEEEFACGIEVERCVVQVGSFEELGCVSG